MKRISILFIISVIVSLAAGAADVSFSVRAPGRVYEGERFAVTYHLSGAQAEDIKVPELEGCRLIYGPAESVSQSYSVVNGRMSSNISADYTYYYRADRAGEITIPAASVIAEGKRYTSKQVKFTIHPTSDRNIPGSQRPVDVDDADTQTAGRRVASDDVFVRIILSRNSAYEQEAITCTIKLYTKYSISSFLPTKQPAFDGFLIQELDVQPALNRQETFNGQQYMTAVLKQCILFPQKSGRLNINSGNYDVSVVQYENVNMGMFQVRQPREQKIKVSSNSASVNIRPLPTPQPEGFTGAVGKFSIDSRLVGNNFRTNDPATLIYTISGTGNIKYVKEPQIDFPSEFEQYTPKADIQTHVQGGDVTGTMTVEYTFVPQSVGNFTIGSDKFVYFDPTTARYVTLTTPSYPIKVAKGLSTPAATEDQKAIENKNSDIRHIYLGDKEPSHDRTLVVDTLWYWLLHAALALALIIVIATNRRIAARNDDIAGMRNAKANKVARKRLRSAEKFLKAGDSDKFYEEMLRALWGYLSDKLGIPGSQLTRDNIQATLEQKNYSPEVAKRLIDVLDECEMARYTPESSSRMDAVITEGANVINSIESSKK